MTQSERDVSPRAKYSRSRRREEKGKGVTVRWSAEGGGKPNPNARDDLSAVFGTGRRTGTGYEVWCTRDERARDCEVFHPQRGVRYKSGVYAPNALCLTLGDLPAARNSGLRTRRSGLSGRQKSAAGRAGGGNEPGPVVRSIPEDSPTEGQNGSRKGFRGRSCYLAWSGEGASGEMPD